MSADERDTTTYSWRYYDAALRVAHAVCAIDTTPTREELLAVDTLRAMMLRRINDGERSNARPTPVPGPRASTAPRRSPSTRRVVARRARRAHRSRGGEDRGPPAHQPRARREPPARAQAARRRPQPAPRVRREPGHRQDDRRAPARPLLQGAEGRLEGPARRDRPFGARRRVRRADRDQGQQGVRRGEGRHPLHRRGVRARRPTASRTSVPKPSRRCSSAWRTTATTSS